VGPGDRFDRYEIEERLGQGGMGEVFRARDTKLERRVALKVVRRSPGDSLGTDGAARILREARAAAALNHANAVAIHDVGEVDGVPYIAMELVSGRPLRAFVGDDSTPLDVKIGWLLDVARVLGAAHEKGLVHRDVKPENVMVRDGDRVVKVLDFGIARRVAGGASADSPTAPALQTITQDGVIVGTPLYMAPEQLRNEPIDGRVDQFAWGVMAYELLTGASPWQSPIGSLEVISEILNFTPPPPRDRNPSIPAAMDAAIVRALAKKREDRLSTMEALVRAASGVDSAGAFAPTEALPSGRIDAVISTKRRPRSRWRVLTGAAIPVVAMAVVAITLTRPWKGHAPSPAASAAASASASTKPPPRYVERKLTSLGAGNKLVTFAVSADMRNLLYEDNEGFWIAPLDGGTRREAHLPAELKKLGPPLGLDLLPDGRILLGWDEARGLPLQIVSADGSSATPARAAGSSFQVSLDGRRIAFEHAHVLYVGDLQGGPATKVADLPADSGPRWQWSPDQTRFAFVRASLGMTEFSIVRADGSASRVLLSDPHLSFMSIGSLTWTAPDAVAYFYYEKKTTTLFEQTIDAAGAAVGAPRKLWEAPTKSRGDMFAAEGRFLWMGADAQNDVYVARTSARWDRLEREPSRLTTSDTRDMPVDWLGDGRVLFSSERDGIWRVFAQRTDGTAPELVLARDGARVYGAGVIDGETISAYAVDDTTMRLLRASMSGAITELASVPVEKDKIGNNFICTPCSGGSRPRCVIGAKRDVDIEYSVIDAQTGERSPPFFRMPEQTLKAGCVLSPDGESITLGSDDRFVVVDVRDGKKREVVIQPSMKIVQFARALPDGQSWFVTGMQFGEHQYAWLKVDSRGRATPIRTSDADWMYSPLLAPNQRDVALNILQFNNEIFTLEPAKE
jgi:serine/threonine-protein kinase